MASLDFCHSFVISISRQRKRGENMGKAGAVFKTPNPSKQLQNTQHNSPPLPPPFFGFPMYHNLYHIISYIIYQCQFASSSSRSFWPNIFARPPSSPFPPSPLPQTHLINSPPHFPPPTHPLPPPPLSRFIHFSRLNNYTFN